MKIVSSYDSSWIVTLLEVCQNDRAHALKMTTLEHSTLPPKQKKK